MDEQTNKKEELRDVVPQLENRFRITIWNRLIVLAKWLIFAALTGLALGLVGTAFGKAFPWLRLFVWLIPGSCTVCPSRAF